MKTLLPREHGGWVVLLVPLFVAMGAAGQWGARSALLLGAVLSFYLARYPLVLWARSRFGPFPENGLSVLSFWLVIGLGLGAVLTFGYRLYLLVPFAVAGALLLMVHLMLVRYRNERTIVGEFLGIGALTLTAPAAFYAVTGNVATLAFLLWFVNAAYFGASVFYVKMRVADRSRTEKPEGRLFAGSLLLYQVVVLICVALLSYFDFLPPLIFVAFLPMALHTVFDVTRREKQLDIKRLGFTLVAHSIAFALLVIGAFWIGLQ
jgi:hypothetical protein